MRFHSILLNYQEVAQSWNPSSPLEDLFVRKLRDGGMVRVRIDLLEGHAMTEFYTIPCPPGHQQLQQQRQLQQKDMDPSVEDLCPAPVPVIKSLSGRSSSSGSSSSSAPVHGVDSEVCNWALEADMHSSFLRFSLVFMDVTKIPRNHLRWALLMRGDRTFVTRTFVNWTFVTPVL